MLFRSVHCDVIETGYILPLRFLYCLVHAHVRTCMYLKQHFLRGSVCQETSVLAYTLKPVCVHCDVTETGFILPLRFLYCLVHHVYVHMCAVCGAVQARLISLLVGSSVGYLALISAPRNKLLRVC